jgi:hypothetical protein
VPDRAAASCCFFRRSNYVPRRSKEVRIIYADSSRVDRVVKSLAPRRDPRRCAGVLAVLLLPCLVPVDHAVAQEHFDVFFLAVGSASYAATDSADINGLPSIPGAVKSAKAFADLMKKGGSTFGVTLISDGNRLVTREDVYAALSHVGEAINKSHSPHPLLVFYFAGHGISEGHGWNLFALPGDFVYRGGNIARDLPALEHASVNAGMLVAHLTEMHVRFMVLLDTCYEGVPTRWAWTATHLVADPSKINTDCSQDITGLCANLLLKMGPIIRMELGMAQGIAGFNKMDEPLRKANRFENTDPVLFSTEPGTTVSTAADPRDSDPRATAVAPLARRAMLVLDPVFGQRGSLSLEDFLLRMKSPDLDPVTQPAVSYSVTPKDASFSLVRPAQEGREELRIGTGQKPSVCCGEEFPSEVVAEQMITKENRQQIREQIRSRLKSPAAAIQNSVDSLNLKLAAQKAFSDDLGSQMSDELAACLNRELDIVQALQLGNRQAFPSLIVLIGSVADGEKTYSVQDLEKMAGTVKDTYDLLDKTLQGKSDARRACKDRLNAAINDRIARNPSMAGAYVRIRAELDPISLDLELVRHWAILTNLVINIEALP